MSIYNDLINVGKWKPIFQREFPNGHFLPLPKDVILTQDICNRYPRTIWGAIQKQQNVVHMYSSEPLELTIHPDIQPISFTLPKPTKPLPIWSQEQAIRYILDSWFSALHYLNTKGKLKDLIFVLAKDPKKNIKITYQSDIGMYKAHIKFNNPLNQPTYFFWNDCNFRLKVGNRLQQSTGKSYLTKEIPLHVPTTYLILSFINQIVSSTSNLGIEELDYKAFTQLFSKDYTYLWLDTNSMGEREIYGMKHPLDSNSYHREFNTGLYLNVDMHSDKGIYPLFYPRKYSPNEVQNACDIIKRSHEQDVPVIPEKNGRITKSLIIGDKGVNNSFVGFNRQEELRRYIVYLLDPGKLEKTFNRIHTGTGGNRAQMEGIERSNINIVNVDGSITSHYGYPINYFLCLGRGYGGNSGVVPVRKDFYIPYSVRKSFSCDVYIDNIPPNSAVESYIHNKAKSYNGSLTKALAEYIKECISEQVVPLLEKDPNTTWHNEYLLTLFHHGSNNKPLKVFHISGSNRNYYFPTPLDLDDMVQEGLNCVHISTDMFFKGQPGEPFKLRMLGGKATTLPCDFTVYQSDNSTPYDKPIDVLMSNESFKGPALWWIAYAQHNGPCYLYPNDGLMKIANGDIVNFLEPNNAINKWLELNAQDVWIEYEVNTEVLRVLRQHPEFIQEWGCDNPMADIHVLKIDGSGALIREHVIGIHAYIPLGYVELSTAHEKVNKSTLTSQQFASLGMLNETLLEGLVHASSWKHDVVERMVQTYIGNPQTSKSVITGKSEQLFLPILKSIKEDLDIEFPERTNLPYALDYISSCLSSDNELIELLDSIYPHGFTYTCNNISLPICLSVLQIYARRNNVSQDVMPITAQVISFIRRLAWAFISDCYEGYSLKSTPSWSNIRSIEQHLDLSILNASISGWMRSLLGDPSADSKVIAALGRINACAQATVKTSHLPSSSNYVVKDDDGTLLYSIPIFYIHPEDDLLTVLFGNNNIPNTSDVNNPYFIACTRTPLGFWVFGRLIISREYGWLSHITMNCVIAQLSSETDGDGDMATIIPVTKYDTTLTYEDIYTYNKSHIGYLGYGLHGTDSTLTGFFEPNSKWASGKHPFRSKPHPLIPLNDYLVPDFVGIVPADNWAYNTHFTERHYTINVGVGYNAYSYVCFNTSKEVTFFKDLCKSIFPSISNTQIIALLNDWTSISNLTDIDPKSKHSLISSCKTTIAHLLTLSLTSRIMYEGMGLSGFKHKAFSLFSLYSALINNPSGKVIGYIDPTFSSKHLLFFRSSDTAKLDSFTDPSSPFSSYILYQHDNGQPRILDGVKHFIQGIFPPEILSLSNGIPPTSNLTSDLDFIYDPIENNSLTYSNTFFTGFHNEVISILKTAGYWGFVHSRLKNNYDHNASDLDVLATVTYRALRDFTSGSLGNSLESIVELGEHSSMSLYLLTLLNDEHWKQYVHDLIPSTQLRSMLFRALPIFEQVYLYKLSQLPVDSF